MKNQTKSMSASCEYAPSKISPTSRRNEWNTTQRDKKTNWIILGLSLSMLLSSLSTSIANVALPTLTEVFNATVQDVQWIILAYLLAITSLIVSVGRLGDMIGRRRLLLSGLLIFSTASVLCALAPNLWLLIGARILQGIGAAIMMALTMALISETVNKEKVGRAMGLLGTMSAVGTALGPTLGGALISFSGWQALFILNVPLGILAFAIIYRHLPSNSQEKQVNSVQFDKLGTLILAFTLTCYALSMTLNNSHFDQLNWALLLMATIGIGVFLWVEKGAISPLVPLSMFRNELLTSGFITSVLATTVVMTTLIVGPFYLSGVLMLSTTQVGLVMSIGPIVAALTGVPAGRIVDSIGSRKVIVIGLVSMATGSFLLSLISASSGVVGYILPLSIITMGYSLFQTSNNTQIMTAVGAEVRGVISGILNLSRNFGLITGASAMGAIFTHSIGTNNISEMLPGTITAGMQSTFVMAGVLIVIAIIMAIFLYFGKDQESNHTNVSTKG